MEDIEAQEETIAPRKKTPAKKPSSAPKKQVAAKGSSLPPSEPSTARLRDFVVKMLDAGKATDIVAIDLAGKSPMADFMVIASATSARAVSALAAKVIEIFEKEGLRVRTEGLQSGDWALVDGGDVVVHIFRPEVRKFYDLERMWSMDFTPTDNALFLK